MLLHLSDLHFGTEQSDRMQAIQQFCQQHEQHIEIVVVSGDLTQRAKYQQFLACRAFLQSLQLPYLVVPGNHDIPLYHVWRRFLSPFARYQFFFGQTEQVIQTKHFYLIGLNSIHPKHHTKGHVSIKQITQVEQLLQQAPKDILKFIVVHQPFYQDINALHTRDDCPKHCEIALKTWANVGLNGLLHGHLHRFALYDLRQYYDLPVAQAVWDIHAGTAISSRLHHQEQNGFNVIYPDGTVKAYLYHPMQQQFLPSESFTF